ncbi:MAG: 50S ribosomal protein L5 [Nitrososphaerota archaeon]
MAETKLENINRRIRISKVIINSSLGAAAARLEKASKILEELTGQKPSLRRAKKTIRGFGIHKGEPIAVMVTLRGEKAIEFLKNALAAVGNKLKESSFDEYGNFAFGIKEHLDIPGTKYNPEVGIIGMDVIVNVDRPGRRVELRRIKRSKIGRNHRITKEESIEFIQKEFNVEIIRE